MDRWKISKQDSAEAPAPASEQRQAAGPNDGEQTEEASERSTSSFMSDFLPMEFSVLWKPWSGDFEGMVERRVIRAVVPYGGYQFFYDEGVPSGAVYELLQRFESFVNKELERRHIRVYVVVIPVGRNELFSALEEGHADLVAGDLTITDERAAQFSFSRPLLRDINEVIVTGPAAPDLPGMDSLTGQEIFVRESSSYFEHLQGLVADLTGRGLEPPVIKTIDEMLEAEDILELVDTGIIGTVVLDDYKADFWAELFPKGGQCARTVRSWQRCWTASCENTGGARLSVTLSSTVTSPTLSVFAASTRDKNWTISRN
jgi:ABC-type amino acid transport substrate-binding protein